MFTSIIKSIRDIVEDFYKTYGSGCFGVDNITTPEYSGSVIICVSDNIPDDVEKRVIAYYYALGTPAGSVASLVFIICGDKKTSFRMFIDPSYEQHISFLNNILVKKACPVLFVKYSDGVSSVKLVFIDIDREFVNFVKMIRALRDFDSKLATEKSFETAMRIINYVLDNLIEDTVVKMCYEIGERRQQGSN
ncbi:MAG: hypothetical protein QW607_06985 [Desulfurococcaceae archaeon]